MPAILSLSWNDAAAEAMAERILAEAGSAGFSQVERTAFGWLGVAGPRRPRAVSPEPTLWIIGDQYAQEGPQPGAREATGDDGLAALVRTRWGRYVALRRDASGRVSAALRDPSGAFEVAIWRAGGVQVIASQTPDWLMRVAPPDVEIDWSGAPALLADPLAALGQPPLAGLIVLDAGEMVDLTTGVRTMAWRPADVLGDPVDDAVVARDGLRARVEMCTRRLADSAGTFGAELSGGLDSAIVAAALGGRRDRCGLWLNALSTRPETDERRYAGRVAEHLGVRLHPVQRLEQALEYEVLARTAGGVRPGFNGADAVFDALVADSCKAAGVQALFTGKGGDAVFFQGATAAVFGDLWADRGAAALFSPVLPAVARWTRQSAWSVLAQAWGRTARRGGGPSAPGLVDFLTPAARAGLRPAPHPWTAELPKLGPAKRMQVEAIASNLAYATACRRTEVVDLIHPLMSQPVVEWCLRIPATVLTEGRTDRFLARSAFAGSLPGAVAWRRSKGDYTATFNREAAASLPFLREHLLEGRLVQKGVLDRSATERLLDRDRLMWAGGSSLITAMTGLESWIRCWEARRGPASAGAAPR